MGNSSWWPVSLRRLHHSHLGSNKPQLQAPIKGIGSVSSPHDDDDYYYHYHHHHHHYYCYCYYHHHHHHQHHHNHNKIHLSDWLSAALITALIRQCYRTVRVVAHTHFYNVFFSLLAKTFQQSCALILSYHKINISDRTLSCLCLYSYSCQNKSDSH